MDKEKLSLLRKFDLNLLVVFYVLTVEKSITETSKILCVDQSTISHSLNRLRSSLDDPLLVRCGNKMELTKKAIKITMPIVNSLEEIATQLYTSPAPGKRSNTK